jgi:kynurenine formamidase
MRFRALHLTPLSVGIGLILCAASGAAQTIDLTRYRLVDLTHAFGSQTLYWPTSPSSFRLERLAFGQTPGGYFYAAYAFSAPEHGGTHLDAPIHFAAGGLTTGGSAAE